MLAVSDAVLQSALQTIQVVLLATISAWAAWKLRQIEKTGEKTHKLVNSNMGALLKKDALLARKHAELTKNPVDDAVADYAEQLYKEHEIKQANVDAEEAANG